MEGKTEKQTPFLYEAEENIDFPIGVQNSLGFSTFPSSPLEQVTRLQALHDEVGEIMWTDGPGDPRVARTQRQLACALVEFVNNVMESDTK
jgi:hypothetical protein